MKIRDLSRVMKLAHTIKGIRKGMRTHTILLKIQQAGLEAPTR